MDFDPNNEVVKLCAQGMQKEGNLEYDEAGTLFLQAWEKATTDFEKFVAAHYLAKHQDLTENKLKWDEKSLSFALKINDQDMLSNYPSLYLNIAKCYEDLKNFEKAAQNYQTALLYADNLPNDGYGQMIRTGITSGISRLSDTTK